MFINIFIVIYKSINNIIFYLNIEKNSIYCISLINNIIP